MSLMAAILSQTNKILGTLINFTGTFPTATINTINTNTQPAAQASATQTGMNSQGYSTGRASNLDNLNTPVSSRAVQPQFRPVISTIVGGNSNGTLISVSGSGYLHMVSYVNAGPIVNFTVIVDGVTVATTSLNSTPGYIQPDGRNPRQQQFADSGNATPVSSGGLLMWPFRTSLVVNWQTLGGGNATLTGSYSLI